MPRKYKNKKRSTRKSNYRRRSYNPVSRQLLPKRRVVNMRYAANFTLDPASGAVANHVFSANGMYDPDITNVVTGHQPLGFDQFVPTLYDHYTVIGSKVTVSFQNDSGSGANTYYGGVRLSDDYNTISSLESILERSRCKWSAIALAEAASPKKIVMKCSPPKFLASAKGALSNAQLRGTSAANPAEQAYWHVWCAASNPSADAATIPIVVTIEYIAVLTEPNSDLSQS